MALVEVTPPAAEPITATEAKSHAVIEHTDDDTLIGDYITAARQYVEAYTGRQLVHATYDLYLDEWPGGSGVIQLPRPPLSSVTHVKYQDTDDAQQTLVEDTDYQVDLLSVPGRIMPEYGEVWPNIYPDSFNGIVIRFVAGYSADDTSVPERFKLAIRQLVADWYKLRLAVSSVPIQPVPFAMKALLEQDRIWTF